MRFEILLHTFSGDLSSFFSVDMRSNKYDMVETDQGSPDEVSGKMKDCRC